MAPPKLGTHQDRAQESSAARKSALEKFRAARETTDPATIARRNELAMARSAKEERRRIADEERKARIKAEAEAAAAEAERLRLEEIVAKERADREAAERYAAEVKYAEMMAAEQKAKRDARYAARKARRG